MAPDTSASVNYRGASNSESGGHYRLVLHLLIGARILIKGRGRYGRRGRDEGALLFDGHCGASWGLQDDEYAGDQAGHAKKTKQRAIAQLMKRALLAECSAFSSSTEESMVTSSSLLELSAALARETA